MLRTNGPLGWTREREIAEPVLECAPGGRVNESAIGWSRHPLHRCNLSGRWPRKKRWHYWCVTTDRWLLALTLADIDFLGLAVATFFEFGSRKLVEKVVATPFGLGCEMPETVGGADLRFAERGLRIAMLEEPGGTRLQAGFRERRGGDLDADVFVEQPSGHETLNVLVPWSEKRFQFTSKQVGLPARGTVKLAGETYAFGREDHAFGCLDFGRGIWPYGTTWNWAAASGRQDGRTIGLNLGGKWTDGSGSTENGFWIDGRLNKIGEDLEFRYDRSDFGKPWRIVAPRSGRLDLGFAPFHERQVRLNLILVASELHWTLGHFSGTLVADDGEEVVVRDLPGWAEEHRARW